VFTFAVSVVNITPPTASRTAIIGTLVRGTMAR